MERHEYFDDWDTGKADLWCPEEETAAPPCLHARVTTRDWDFGIDPETGYHDCGTEVECLDCGDIWGAEEYAEYLAALEPTRKPVASEGGRVDIQEVA